MNKMNMPVSGSDAEKQTKAINKAAFESKPEDGQPKSDSPTPDKKQEQPKESTPKK